MSRTALVAGATGLVGSHVLAQLLADAHWSRVVTVGRRTRAQQHSKLEQRVLDLGAIETANNLPHVDDVFCCLGTKSTWASLPTSTDTVTGIPGNTTSSSKGMIRSLFIVRPE